MTTTVLIHGFAGSPESWRRVARRLRAATCAPSVCGHGTGASAVVGAHSFETEVDRLASEIGAVAPEPRYLAGYSLGGRLALGLLIRHPDLFVGAAVIGANPGIGGKDERTTRRAADEAWARLIEERGLDAFDREWSNMPLFRRQRQLEAKVLEEQRRIRLDHDPAGLAAAMRTLSLGAMPDYRPALAAVACPVELIAGALDVKFSALAGQMAEYLPQAAVRLLDGVGHNVPLEAPAELARLLNDAAGGRSDGSRDESGVAAPASRGRCSVAGRRRGAG